MKNQEGKEAAQDDKKSAQEDILVDIADVSSRAAAEGEGEKSLDGCTTNQKSVTAAEFLGKTQENDTISPKNDSANFAGSAQTQNGDKTKCQKRAALVRQKYISIAICVLIVCVSVLTGYLIGRFGARDIYTDAGFGGTVTTFSINSVAHRGFSVEAPENTLAAFRLAKQRGFSAVECDVSFTSDGHAVLLHDNTIDRTSNGSGRIDELTLADVREYDFGGWKSLRFAGERIPTFSEFLGLCRELRLHPYIEIKSGASAAQVAGLVATVAQFGMLDCVTWISFEKQLLECVSASDATARLGYLLNGLDEAGIASALTLRTGQNEVFVDVNFARVSYSDIALCVAEKLPVEVWTVNNASTILGLNPYISGVTSDSLIAATVLYERALEK